MSLPNFNIVMTNNVFVNPRVSPKESRNGLYVESLAMQESSIGKSKYVIETVLESSPKIHMSKNIVGNNNPVDLFTSGFMKINYIAPIKQNVNIKNNQIINFKCNQIDADNCFKLYRSPLPDFYEMKSYGSTNSVDRDPLGLSKAHSFRRWTGQTKVDGRTD